ncbi:MAG: orotate phosphoribosyltransferase [Phycisphaeraceae bacterium]|nr:MAG: orotate phosphoribosyltransferase [Phycisphaeraceae bacterium]
MPDLATARHPDLARCILERAVTRGEFTLASGAKSDYYCDVRLVSLSGEGARLIADALLEETADLDFDALGGMDMGATPIAAAFGLRAHEQGLDIPTFVVRKNPKAHGTQKLIEGPLPETPQRVVIVDDVVTSGGSLIKAIEVAKQAGHSVVKAFAVLDRESGGSANIAATGVDYQPLVSIHELGLG